MGGDDKSEHHFPFASYVTSGHVLSFIKEENEVDLNKA